MCPAAEAGLQASLALNLFLHTAKQQADDLCKLFPVGHFVNWKSLLTWTPLPCQDNSK